MFCWCSKFTQSTSHTSLFCILCCNLFPHSDGAKSLRFVGSSIKARWRDLRNNWIKLIITFMISKYASADRERPCNCKVYGAATDSLTPQQLASPSYIAFNSAPSCSESPTRYCTPQPGGGARPGPEYWGASTGPRAPFQKLILEHGCFKLNALYYELTSS